LQQKRRLCGIEHTCDCDVNDDALDDTRSTIAAFAALVQHFYVRIAELEASVQAERAPHVMAAAANRRRELPGVCWAQRQVVRRR